METRVDSRSSYRWRNEYGDLQVNQAKRLKELEQAKARLKRVVAGLTLAQAMLKELASGNF